MKCSFFFSPDMALAGHKRAQAPQPLHFSVIVWGILFFLLFDVQPS
jgi:hypothetical protein